MNRMDSFKGSTPLTRPVLHTYTSSSVTEEGLRGKKESVTASSSRQYSNKVHGLPGEIFYGNFTE